MIGYGSFNKKNFIRLVTVNSSNTKNEIFEMFKVLENFVEKNKDKLHKI